MISDGGTKVTTRVCHSTAVQFISPCHQQDGEHY